MQPTENPEGHRASEIEPPLRHTAPWRVTTVAISTDRCLHVTFVDGTEGEIDMREFLADPKLDGTIFEPLRDPKTFAEVRVVLGGDRVAEWGGSCSRRNVRCDSATWGLESRLST